MPLMNLSEAVQDSYSGNIGRRKAHCELLMNLMQICKAS